MTTEEKFEQAADIMRGEFDSCLMIGYKRGAEVLCHAHSNYGREMLSALLTHCMSEHEEIEQIVKDTIIAYVYEHDGGTSCDTTDDTDNQNRLNHGEEE